MIESMLDRISDARLRYVAHTAGEPGEVRVPAPLVRRLAADMRAVWPDAPTDLEHSMAAGKCRLLGMRVVVVGMPS